MILVTTAPPITPPMIARHEFTRMLRRAMKFENPPEDELNVLSFSAVHTRS
jgi:hypothetical protein